MIITDPTEYRASEAVSFSRLKVFDACPFLYFKRFVLKTVPPDEDTKAMRIGSAAHCRILEGELAYRERYVTKPASYEGKDGPKDWNANAAVCRAWEDNERALGRTVLTAAEDDLLYRLAMSVKSNPDAVELLGSGRPELAIRRPFPSLGLEIQGRLDWLKLDPGVVVDLKTIECLDDLPREIERRGYYRQKAHYRHLASEEFGADFRCAIIGIEKAEPMRCGVYWLRDDLLTIGDAHNLASLGRLAECYRTGDWGGNPATREIGPSVELQLASAAEADACA